jgi:hypothetical protein
VLEPEDGRCGCGRPEFLFRHYEGKSNRLAERPSEKAVWKAARSRQAIEDQVVLASDAEAAVPPGDLGGGINRGERVCMGARV